MLGPASAAAGRRTRRWPLLLKLGLASVLIVILLSLLAGELTRRYEQQYLLDNLRAQSHRISTVLSGAALEAVISEDIAVLNTLVRESVQSLPAIQALRIENERGEVLVSWDRNAPQRFAEQVTFSEPIRYDGDLYGNIHIDWLATEMRRQIEDHVGRARYWISAILAACALCLFVAVYALVSRPLSRIHQRLLGLAQGDLQSRLALDGAREIVSLGEAVNTLLDTLIAKREREQELERAREALFDAKERAEVTLHSIGDAVITTNADAQVEYLNPVAERLTGWCRTSARGRRLEEVFQIVDETTREPRQNPVYTALRERRIVMLENHTVLLTHDGQEVAIEDSAAPILGRDGEVLGAVLVFHNVTKARHLIKKIEYQASHDELTGLLNRREFERRLGVALEGVSQEPATCALLYLDLDQFKVVNDTCGHAAGDALLKQLAPLIRQQLRASDSVGRLGGDEFGVILLDCARDSALQVAEKLNRAVSGFRFSWAGKTFAIGVSIGMVTFDSDTSSSESLLREADEACYMAKERGRNRVQVYRHDDQTLLQRRGEMQWVSRLHAALDEDRLVLYAQPIRPLSGAGGEGLHFEILLRLRDEHGELAPPGAFLPAAERFGLMPMIDRWVVSRVFSRLAAEGNRLEALGLCTINISASSLTDKRFLDFVVEHLETLDLPSNRICFEITETAAISNMSEALTLMETLRGRGCVFALDDFGSGMSSFGYLKSLPVDYLKIEGGFIKEILNDETSLAIVKTINEIGHIMGKRNIAEFVENDAVLARLRELGVDYAQGYGISRPLPLEEVLTGLETSAPGPVRQLGMRT